MLSPPATTMESFAPSPLLPEPAQREELHSLLRSHCQPPDHLASTISALSGELARYDAEIGRLQAQLDRMASERAALESYYELYRSLLSPIRRLPSEILVKIFTLFCPDPLPTPLRSIASILSAPGQDPMAQFAQESLLTLSQVCARWHSICIGTPTFWTNIQLDSVLWSTPARTSKMMTLLTNALERGGRSPLSLTVKSSPDASYAPALELLAAHSERWQTACFMCAASDMQHLSSVRGRLPLLQTLALWVTGTSLEIEIFEDVPRLTVVQVAGIFETIEAFTTLPLHQLQIFGCGEFVGLTELLGFGVSPAMSLMPRLSRTTDFHFQLISTNHATPFNESTSMPHITAEIAGLSLDVLTRFSPTSVGPMLAKIVESLTLPGLKELRIECRKYPLLPLPWPHTQFLALAARSSFSTHLQNLELSHSIITEIELIECLSALASLERLAISDHLSVEDGGADQLLITDTLLTHLTRTPPSACPVPHLRVLCFQTLLQFDDTLFLNFLLSRLYNERPFNSQILCLPGHRRDLDPSVVVRIDQLRFQKTLVFSFA
ncbi:hypothetical protein FB451DRAFT_1558270 [Mycena latifolia]|nr:hypothetical protein FB451DRAFT_1558270 [Mycena latifolia]